MAVDLRPMLASPSTGAGGRHAINVRTLVESGDWALDLKLDGIRAVSPGNHWLYNRQGVDITDRFPEIKLPGLWLDGEIVSLDGKFETVARRDKQTSKASIKRSAEAHPCRFVAFDHPGVRSDWGIRRSTLERNHEGPITPVGYDLDFMERVRALGMEGVIAKRLASRYQHGKRSPDWVKFKFLHRVSCLVAGYEPGNGSREHFGAMKLALINETGKVVPVGKVGSGFTQNDTVMLKTMLDNGEGFLIAEIECLNVTSGGTLRFPVYRGLRYDIPLQDCTTAQLDTIPRSAKEA